MGIGEIRSKWVEDDEANWINVGMKKNWIAFWSTYQNKCRSKRYACAAYCRITVF